MSETAAVTRQLLSAPLPQIIERLGIAIADAQAALDRNSIATAQAMATTDIEIGGETHNLISLGFTPTFYSFTEATVEAKLSFSMTESTEFGVSAGASVGVNTGFVMVAASVNVSYARKFSVSAEGMSSIAARLVSLPPPEILENLLRRISEPTPIP
ncbi:MAG: hypothetical protein QM608_00880 [Caulobacter sp.]